jgi:hypothetical protein
MSRNKNHHRAIAAVSGNGNKQLNLTCWVGSSVRLVTKLRVRMTPLPKLYSWSLLVTARLLAREVRR